MKKEKNRIFRCMESLVLAFVLVFGLSGCGTSSVGNGNEYHKEESVDLHDGENHNKNEVSSNISSDIVEITLADIPEYSGKAYVSVNDGNPLFTKDELAGAVNSFEEYGELDKLGRCTTTIASVGQDIMPTEERGSIGSVKPTGWHTVKYDNVEGKYLYNRCHLIGFQLTGENANERNLITGTRYLNIEGMLPFENMIADYVKETENHVLFRVTPMYENNDLVAKGVLMEAISVEDNGDGIYFCVFAYNVQPGIVIDYATGESMLGNSAVDKDSISKEKVSYVLNTSSMKFHSPECSAVEKISDANRKNVKESRQELIDDGYSPCGICKP